MNIEIANRLVKMRKAHGYSQEELAEKLGISRQAYAKWESGDAVPDVERAAQLAALYGVTVDSLMKTETEERIGTSPPPPRGKIIWGTVTLGERGQLVIPKAARDKFDLKSGDRIVVVSDEQGIALLPAEFFEQKMREVMELISGEAKY